MSPTVPAEAIVESADGDGRPVRAGGANGAVVVAAPPASIGVASRAPDSPLTPLIKELFLDEVANGAQVRDICRSLGMNPGSFYRWKRLDQTFYDEFDATMKDGLHVMGDETLVIADNSALSPEDRKVRIHTRFQLMARRAAGTYADKLLVDARVTTRNLNVNVSADPVEAARQYQDMLRDQAG